MYKLFAFCVGLTLFLLATLFLFIPSRPIEPFIIPIAVSNESQLPESLAEGRVEKLESSGLTHFPYPVPDPVEPQLRAFLYPLHDSTVPHLEPFIRPAFGNSGEPHLKPFVEPIIEPTDDHTESQPDAGDGN